MKTKIRVLAIALGLFCAASGFAQTSAADAMKSATTAATGAATTAVNNAKTNAAAAVAAKVNPPAAAPATTPAAAPVAAPAKAAVAGGAGKVWVNTSSKTYHCEGSKFYGKTKTGEYMTEADAKAKGNHAVKGKACSK